MAIASVCEVVFLRLRRRDADGCHVAVLAGDLERVDTGRLPPCGLVPDPVSRTVMGPAERDHEFIAGLAAERPRLHVSEMMGIRWLAAADQARLLDDIAKVVPIAIATRLSDREDALVDAVRPTGIGAFGGDRLRGSSKLSDQRIFIRRCASASDDGELRELPFEGVLDELGIGCREAILGTERPALPNPRRDQLM